MKSSTVNVIVSAVIIGVLVSLITDHIKGRIAKTPCSCTE